MAKKTGKRAGYKEVENRNRNYETHSDEIALRDEILELKRQLVALKKTNEQYLVKLRKYEDEAKRKDKQVEQLMDPRKNAEVTKVLSTKGAAILMNLKDQNNALIQMILNKDLYIRRLVAEIKMSKLYATTSKNERAEINRLRNLLIKSQEALKQNDVKQNAKSICASGNSFIEFSSSSAQSSPRDLDELRIIILGLESHIKQTNDLLASKTHEISVLNNELNFLRQFYVNNCKNKTFEHDTEEFKNKTFSTVDYTNKWSEPPASTKIFTPEAFEQSGKNEQEENLPHSTPATLTSSKCSASVESTPKYNFFSRSIIETKQNRIEDDTDSLVITQTNHEDFEKVPLLEKSFYHGSASNEILNKQKLFPHTQKKICTKEKWMKALNEYRKIKKSKLVSFTGSEEAINNHKQTENVFRSELFNEDSEKFEIGEKSHDIEPENFQKHFEIEKSSDFKSVTIVTTDIGDSDKTKTCQNPEPSFPLNNKDFSVQSISNHETNRQILEKQMEILKTVAINSEEEENNMKSFEDIPLHSGFDSENSSPMNQKVQKIKTEVQVHSFSPQISSDHSCASISENDQSSGEQGESPAFDLFNINDDDDVIIREK